MTERERMDRGLVYLPTDENIQKEQQDCLELLYDYNHTRPHDTKRRAELLRQMFAEIGENCYFEPPLYSNFGCRHVHVGNNVYGNFGVTFVDDADIFVGDCVMLAPHVVIATAGHPVLPALRERGMQFNRSVHIGRNVWIGAGAVVLPGVSVGENSVIGAGSIVTKDIPPDVVAAGNPCRVLREIGEKDKLYFFKNEQFDFSVGANGELIGYDKEERE